MEVNGNTKVMYWNSLRGMKPVTADSTIELPSIVQLKFMWKPTANNSSVSLADENRDNIFTIAKNFIGKQKTTLSIIYLFIN